MIITCACCSSILLQFGIFFCSGVSMVIYDKMNTKQSKIPNCTKEKIEPQHAYYYMHGKSNNAGKTTLFLTLFCLYLRLLQGN